MGTPLYGLYRYVRPKGNGFSVVLVINRVSIFSHFAAILVIRRVSSLHSSLQFGIC